MSICDWLCVYKRMGILVNWVYLLGSFQNPKTIWDSAIYDIS